MAQAGRRALELADRVMAGILDHARRVQLSASPRRKLDDSPHLGPGGRAPRHSPDEAKKAAIGTTTYMDDRTVVPSELSDAPPLDGKTKIPPHMTLDVLATRTLVDRAMPVKPLERSENFSESAFPRQFMIRASSCRLTSKRLLLSSSKISNMHRR